MKDRARIFCKRLNKINKRLGLHKRTTATINLVHEFKAVECSFDHSMYRLDNIIVEKNSENIFEVRK